jgi:transcriptional regulator with XRE-family HTH domain
VGGAVNAYPARPYAVRIDPDQAVRALAWRVHGLRVAAFLTQDGLARRAGLSRDTVARLEAGRISLGRPRMSTLTALAAALGVEPDQLLPDPRQFWGPELHD